MLLPLRNGKPVIHKTHDQLILSSVILARSFGVRDPFIVILHDKTF